MAINLDAFAIQVVVSTIVGAPVLWLSGRALVGEKKAKFTDAIWIIVLGDIVGGVVAFIISGVVGGIIVILIWLGLVRHFFDCSWGRAFLIALLSGVVFIVIGAALAAAGFLVIRAF